MKPDIQTETQKPENSQWKSSVNSLLLNASFIDNLGLMHGKMGISICFFHLARQTGNQIYEDYAGELIDEIYEEITANTPVDFENGLAGIGWGIEYLVQNGFIEADTDEVLEEFDNRIFKELIYNTPQYIGLLNGLLGIGFYFLKRIKNKAFNDEKIPTLTNKQTLIHLIDELDRRLPNEEIEKLLNCKGETKKAGSTEHEAGREKTTGTLNLSGNSLPKKSYGQTFEPTNYEQQTTNKKFDLTWNYPALLWFLSELYEQNIFNFKVEKIIQRLTEPLSDESNLPKLQSNRLLLALALTNFQTTVKSSNSRTIIEQSSIWQTIISTLLSGINRKTINSELPTHNTTLRYGTSGIAWIYQQLHHQTGDNHFEEEMEYWQQLSFESEILYDVFPGMNNKDLNAWGLLEGLAGMLLNNETINLKKPKKR